MKVCRGFLFVVEYQATKRRTWSDSAGGSGGSVATGLEAVQVVANDPADAIETARQVLSARSIPCARSDVHQVLARGEVWFTLEDISA